MRKSPKKLWNEFDAVFKPYNARLRTAITPNIAPYSWQHVDQIFSAHGDVKKEFPFPPAIRSSKIFTDIISINMKDMSLMVYG